MSNSTDWHTGYREGMRDAKKIRETFSPVVTPQLLEKMRDFITAESKCWVNVGTGEIDTIEVSSAGKLVQEALNAIATLTPAICEASENKGGGAS